MKRAIGSPLSAVKFKSIPKTQIRRLSAPREQELEVGPYLLVYTIDLVSTKDAIPTFLRKRRKQVYNSVFSSR